MRRVKAAAAVAAVAAAIADSSNSGSKRRSGFSWQDLCALKPLLSFAAETWSRLARQKKSSL
jgi:hypothetical protein